MGADPPGGVSPVFEALKRQFPGPVMRGRVEPSSDMRDLEGAALIAYAGIGDPERFFRLAESFRPAVLTRRPFGDHHTFTEREAEALLTEADAARAVLLTTEKDLARLSRLPGARAELASRSRAVPIAVRFDERDEVRLEALVDGALKGGAR
jgi:tetraacyldisaccharide 4'-kinase